MTVKNIFCVGRNYVLHAKELNNPVPESPLLFTKPTHALVVAQGQEITLPGGRGQIQFEVEYVIHIARRYEPGMSFEELVDKMALGIDFTLRDIQSQFKQKGYPWLLCKGFVNSAVITPWLPFAGLKETKEKDFSLEKNGREVQRGNIKDMIFDLPTITEYTARHLGLDQGDIIFTGTPAGSGPVSDGDKLVFKWDDGEVGCCSIKLETNLY
ncbi:MAG: fumarylacetoacetate hydrolase family protein [Peptococcaceae bacterium]|nr:fumarylacetoacetate hydrolase family protein [Peptococcaceae bacterium]